jgi:hypothetical protein
MSFNMKTRDSNIFCLIATLKWDLEKSSCRRDSADMSRLLLTMKTKRVFLLRLLSKRMKILCSLKVNMRKQISCGIKKIQKKLNWRLLLSSNIESQWIWIHKEEKL